MNVAAFGQRRGRHRGSRAVGSASATGLPRRSRSRRTGPGRRAGSRRRPAARGITSSVGSGSVTAGALAGLQPAGHVDPARSVRPARRATAGAQPRTTSTAGAVRAGAQPVPHTATGVTAHTPRRPCRSRSVDVDRRARQPPAGELAPAGPRRRRGRGRRTPSPTASGFAGAWARDVAWSSRRCCQASYCQSPSSTAAVVASTASACSASRRGASSGDGRPPAYGRAPREPAPGAADPPLAETGRKHPGHAYVGVRKADRGGRRSSAVVEQRREHRGKEARTEPSGWWTSCSAATGSRSACCCPCWC